MQWWKVNYTWGLWLPPSFVCTSLDITFQQNSPNAAAGRAARPTHFVRGRVANAPRLRGDSPGLAADSGRVTTNCVGLPVRCAPSDGGLRTFRLSLGRQALYQRLGALLLQKLRISAIQNNWQDWRNSKHLGTRLQATKYPDAIARSPANINYCIEVEREIKSSKRLRTIFASHLSMRKKGHREKILYLCPSSEIAKRLALKASTLSYLTWEGRRISLRNEHLIHFIFADYGYFKSIY